jgi:hypothetical protein
MAGTCSRKPVPLQHWPGGRWQHWDCECLHPHSTEEASASPPAHQHTLGVMATDATGATPTAATTVTAGAICPRPPHLAGLDIVHERRSVKRTWRMNRGTAVNVQLQPVTSATTRRTSHVLPTLNCTTPASLCCITPSRPPDQYSRVLLLLPAPRPPTPPGGIMPAPPPPRPPPAENSAPPLPTSPRPPPLLPKPPSPPGPGSGPGPRPPPMPPPAAARPAPNPSPPPLPAPPVLPPPIRPMLGKRS